MSILFFFSCITAMVENKKVGKRRIDSGSIEEGVEESSNNNCVIFFWIVLNWPEYGISSFAEHISREFLTAEFDLISCKAIRSRGRLAIYLFIVNTVTSVACSIAIYLPFIQMISIFQKKIRKLEQITIRCYCPVTIHKAKRP